MFPSLGILRVASSLEQAGHEVEHLDLNGIDNFLDAVASHATYSTAHTFGLTATSPQMPATTKIVSTLRQVRPDAKIILGGPHVTLVNAGRKKERARGIEGRATDTFSDLATQYDVLVAGDGEDAVHHAIMPDAPKLIDADDAASALFLTNERYDELPLPARHLLDMKSYHYTIEGVESTSLVGQLGCPYMSLTGDSLIFTSRGIERLDAMIEGDGVEHRCIHGLTVRRFNLNRRVSTHAGEALADILIDEGEHPVYLVETENGLRLKGTATHPFLVVRGDELHWVPLSGLAEGDYLVLRQPEVRQDAEYIKLCKATEYPSIPAGGFPRRSEQMPATLTPDVAWLVGYLIGDGCLPKDGRPSVHLCVTDKTEERLKNLVRAMFGVDLSVNASSQTQNMRHGWIHCRAAYQFFTEVIGIDPKDKLHVPGCISASPKEVIRSFIDGLFAADGYTNGGKPYLTTASYDLAREVALLMLMLGEVPAVQSVQGRGHGHGTYYRVGNYYNDRIPTAKALYRSRKSGKWHWRTPRQPWMFLGVRRRTLRESGLRHPLDIEGNHYVRVKSIAPAGNERVYDIQVPEHHSFIANGIAVHNCSFCGGRNSPMLRRIRSRSVDNVIGELRHLHQTYGYTGWMHYDDELNVSKSMVPFMDGMANLADELGVTFQQRGFIKSNLFNDHQAEAMVRAGFRWILVGFESGSPRILENIQKKATREQNSECMAIARRHGLKVKALMSIGHAGESEQTIAQTKEWLLEEQPDDFDATVITTYPGCPYFDDSVETKPNVWTYAAKSGDRLHSIHIDFNRTEGYYKGKLEEYHSYVYTDHLTPDEIVGLRDELEADVRARLGIPFNPSAPGVSFEASMGQLPGYILRKTQQSVPA